MQVNGRQLSTKKYDHRHFYKIFLNNCLTEFPQVHVSAKRVVETVSRRLSVYNALPKSVIFYHCLFPVYKRPIVKNHDVFLKMNCFF